MTTYQTPIIAGVFKDEMEARKAVDMLRTAQFERDQLGVAIRNGGSATESLSNDFINLGVPQERANFYEHEFRAGKIVVSVRPDGREEEAQTILSSSGAYDYDTITPPTEAPTTEIPDADRPTVDAQAAAPPIELEQPEHEYLAPPAEHSAMQETVDAQPADSHAQVADAEAPINEPAEDTHDQSQIAEPETPIAEHDVSS